MKDLMKDSLFEEFMQEFLHITERERVSLLREILERDFSLKIKIA